MCTYKDVARKNGRLNVDFILTSATYITSALIIFLSLSTLIILQVAVTATSL